MTVRETTVDDLAAARDAGEVTLVDVRNPDEYAAGHVPGARPIPLSELEDRLDEIPREGPVHTICQGGGRSAQAAELLTGHGVDAVSVAGGTQGWITSGREVSTGSDA